MQRHTRLRFIPRPYGNRDASFPLTFTRRRLDALVSQAVGEGDQKLLNLAIKICEGTIICEYVTLGVLRV